MEKAPMFRNILQVEEFLEGFLEESLEAFLKQFSVENL